MSRTFHVTREVVRREVVLCTAEDEPMARRLAGRGGGEMIDSTEESSVLNVEETPHSKRRRNLAKAFRASAEVESGIMASNGVEGDGLLGSGVTILDSGEEPPPMARPLRDDPADQAALRHAADPDSWRDMQPGEVPEAGDEYRLRDAHPWEPVTRSLIGHAISNQARAQFRTRRNP